MRVAHRRGGSTTVTETGFPGMPVGDYALPVRRRIPYRYGTVHLGRRPGVDVVATHEPARRAVAPDAARPEQPALIPLLPGEQTLARRLRFLLANGCTVASLLLGMFSILLSIGGDLRTAAACLAGGVIFDGLDGALARRLGVASPFGAQLDSLADMCTFGIATPVVVYTSLNGSAPAVALAAACAVLAASAAIRLARFNVSPRDGRFFVGVPTTMTAAVLSVGTLIDVRLPGAVAVATLVLLGLAMVSGFPYAKLSRIAKLPPWLLLLPVLGSLLDYRVTFAAVVLAYLVSGPALWLRRYATA